MALLDIIFGGPEKAQIGVMELDASVRETHEVVTTVSENEIEDGSNVADHVRLQPRGLSIDGYISDAPITLLGSVIGLGVGLVTGAVGGALGGIAGAIAGTAVASLAGLITGSPRDPKDSFKYLEELAIKREPFTVITSLKRYENVVITNLSIPRSARVGKSLQFTCQFKQITIVKSASIKIPAITVAPDTTAGAQSNSKLGKQGSKEASGSTGSKASLLLRGFQKAGFFTG